MSKIASDHLSRQAFVYVRQSSRDQLRHNHESRRRQYGLADRARRLGWTDPVVVDDDLGRSGGGSARPGFERLLLAICEGHVGIVLAVDASRLARNGRDWHTLLKFCGLVSCLLADEEAVYDPRLPDDRVLLGMKGLAPQPVAVAHPRAPIVDQVAGCFAGRLLVGDGFGDRCAVALEDAYVTALPEAVGEILENHGPGPVRLGHNQFLTTVRVPLTGD